MNILPNILGIIFVAIIGAFILAPMILYLLEWIIYLFCHWVGSLLTLSSAEKVINYLFNPSPEKRNEIKKILYFNPNPINEARQRIERIKPKNPIYYYHCALKIIAEYKRE